MVNKIFSIGDIHIKPLKGHESLNEVLQKFLEEVKVNKPDRVTITGDVFHNKITVSSEMQLLFGKFLKELVKYTKVIIILGNHDLVIGSTRIDSITPIIEMLDHENIIFYKNSGCFFDKWQPSDEKNKIVWCVWSCMEEQKDPEIEEFKKNNELTGNETFIGLYHGVIQSAKTAIGYQFEEDHGARLEQFKDCDLFIASDIHLLQEFTYENYKGEGFGFYTSSIAQHDQGENLDKHGFIHLQKNNDKWSYKHCELPNDYSYHTLKLTSFEELNNL